LFTVRFYCVCGRNCDFTRYFEILKKYREELNALSSDAEIIEQIIRSSDNFTADVEPKHLSLVSIVGVHNRVRGLEWSLHRIAELYEIINEEIIDTDPKHEKTCCESLSPGYGAALLHKIFREFLLSVRPHSVRFGFKGDETHVYLSIEEINLYGIELPVITP
jgi:hypothetical protein